MRNPYMMMLTLAMGLFGCPPDDDPGEDSDPDPGEDSDPDPVDTRPPGAPVRQEASPEGPQAQGWSKPLGVALTLLCMVLGGCVMSDDGEGEGPPPATPGKDCSEFCPSDPDMCKTCQQVPEDNFSPEPLPWRPGSVQPSRP